MLDLKFLRGYHIPAQPEKGEKMSSVEYKVVASTVSVFEEVEKEVYGVNGYKSGKLAVVIEDISPDRSKVEAFVRECNEKGVEPDKLTEAAEDYLVRLSDVPVNGN